MFLVPCYGVNAGKHSKLKEQIHQRLSALSFLSSCRHLKESNQRETNKTPEYQLVSECIYSDGVEFRDKIREPH